MDFTCRPDLAETAAPPEGPAEPDPATPADISPAIETYEGYAQLTWQPATAPDGALSFELQQSRDSQFSSPRIIYRGRDLASLVSGLPDGPTG